MLKAGRWTIKDLVDRFDSSKSSMYRYMELLEEAGFFIERDFHDRHFIITTDDYPLSARFTTEETHLLRTLIQTNSHNPLAASVLKKLELFAEQVKWHEEHFPGTPNLEAGTNSPFTH